MKAWRAHELGAPTDALRLDDVAEPVPGPAQVAVRVLGAAANFPDVLMVAGLYQVRPELPFTPGVELSGVVTAVGAEVVGISVGDRVLGPASLPAGAFAEVALMDAIACYPAPESLDDAEAAALHIAYQTGWFGLHRRAALQPGETLLVHAAAGGVGSAAVQLGKAAGATVIGVVGGESKVAVARDLGCDVVIDRTTDDVVATVKEVTAGRGVNVVYDPVGGEAYAQSAKVIAFEGRILVVGFAGGDIQSVALNHALIKNYSIVGLHWGLYARHDVPAMWACHEELVRLADAGVVRPLVGERVGLTDVPAALERLAAGSTVGRVVMLPTA